MNSQSNAAAEKVNATGLRVGIATSRYHTTITESMRQSAVEAFIMAGGEPHDLVESSAAGAFELTAIVQALAAMETRTGKPAFDAIVALGCIITGQTTHDQHIANSVTQGLTSIMLETGIPIAFGVLTCQSLEQARQRTIDADKSGGRNKGAEAMEAALQSARTIRELRNMKGRG
jgi:6,7-dimethyl-8-ribityllumazine synthase